MIPLFIFIRVCQVQKSENVKDFSGQRRAPTSKQI